ncbi:MAG: N-acetylmuramoyl-L-alanine amidase [Ruminococcaceae bacterium]|nr:N-acetylmuramoyl-L-alanine amidase [Oscillospiraceae bacterium]
MKNKHNAIGFVALSLIFSLLLSLFCLLGASFSRVKEKSVIGKQNYTVVLDAGHGGEDGGASSTSGLLEKELNLAIATDIGAYLELCGISVVYTRTEDILLYDRNENYQGRKKILDLAARLKIAREYENAVFVSIHMNAFPQKQYKGLQVYYSPNHPLSKALASTVQENARNCLDRENQRKIKKATSSIYLLDRLEKPAILIECGFLSNDTEAERLASEEYQKQLALVIAQSIAENLMQ